MFKQNSELIKILNDIDCRFEWAFRLLNVCKFLGEERKSTSKYPNAFGYLENVCLRSLILELCILFQKRTAKKQTETGTNLTKMIDKMADHLKKDNDDLKKIADDIEKVIKLMEKHKIYFYRNKFIAHLNRPKNQQKSNFDIKELINTCECILNRTQNIIETLHKLIHFTSYNKSLRNFDLALSELKTLTDVLNKNN